MSQNPTETISLDSTSDGGSAEAPHSPGPDVVDLTSDQAAVVDLTNDTVLVLDEDQTQSYVVSSDEEDPTQTGTRPEPRTGAKRSTGVHITCPICMDAYFEIVDSGRLLVSTKCGHVFCSVCLRDALNQTQTCPICRTRLKRGQTHPLHL